MQIKKEEKSSSLLDNLVIASPCSVPWDAMSGDDRKRLCNGCTRFVHNISDMTQQEAEQFLRDNGTSQCMIFYRRFDGTILTDDCPVGLRKLRAAGKWILKVAAGVIAMLVSTPCSLAQAQKTGDWSLGRLFNIQENAAKLLPGQPRTDYANPAGGVRMMPPPTSTTDKPVQPPTNKPNLPETPDPRTKMDTVAFGYFQKGEQAQRNGHKPLAEFYFEKALEAYDKQPAGDKQFRLRIEQALKGLNAPASCQEKTGIHP